MQGSRVVGIDFGTLIEMFSYLDLGFAQDYPRLAFAFGLRLSRPGSLQLWGIFTSRSSTLSTTRTACAAVEVYTTTWCEHSPHVPRNLCARPRQLSLYCSLRHTQHLGCLKDRETVDDA